jgi:mRNA interferase RelE/StbE
MEKIESLAEDPTAPNNNVRKLTNHPGYRLRVGDWRVVYTILEQALLIAIVRIAPRGDVYQ